MSEENINILKYNHVEKIMKAPFLIYADFFFEKIGTSHNNPKEPLTTKMSKHTSYSLFTHCSFDATKYELD